MTAEKGTGKRNENDFFKQLAEKTRQEPSPGFDRGFWARFHAEFGPEAGSSPWSKLMAALTSMKLAGAMAGLMVVVTTAVVVSRARQGNPLLEAGRSGVDAGLLANFREIDAMAGDLALLSTLDDVELSDEDWTLLLEGRSA